MNNTFESLENIALAWCKGDFEQDLATLRLSQFGNTKFLGTGKISGQPIDGLTLFADGAITEPAHKPKSTSRTFPLNYMMVFGGSFDKYEATGSVMFSQLPGPSWSSPINHVSVKLKNDWPSGFDETLVKRGTYQGLVTLVPEELLTEEIDIWFAGKHLTKGISLEIDGAHFILGYVSDKLTYLSASISGIWKSLDVLVLMAAANFLQALSFRVGYNVRWTAVLSDVFHPFLTLCQNEKQPDRRFPPIPYTASSSESGSLLTSLYQAIREQERHPLKVYPWLFYNTLDGNFETSVATLGPAIEALVTLVTSSDLIANLTMFATEKGLFEKARDEITEFITLRPKTDLTPAFERLHGYVAAAKFINVRNAFKLIENAFGIFVTKKEQNGFNAMRNPASHGRIEGFTEEQYETFFHCLNLYYKIALAYLGYNGQAIAYSHPWFQVVSFSCHRYGVLAIMESSSHSEIAERAYSLWEKRGRGHGNDVLDWMLAECQLSQEAATSQWFIGGHGSLSQLRTTS